MTVTSNDPNHKPVTWQHDNDLDFEVETTKVHGQDGNRYCWSMYHRNALIGRGWPRTRIGMAIAMRLEARRYRIKVRKGTQS